MIDIFSILLTHGLILLVGWRLLSRADLDDDDAVSGEPPARAWLAHRASERSQAEDGADA